MRVMPDPTAIDPGIAEPLVGPQLAWTLALAGYVIALLFALRWPYEAMVRRGVEPIRAVYYTRKLVHMLAAGVPSLAVPLVFTSPVYPVASGAALGLLLYGTHATGRRMHWFQIEENMNDVSFAVMWWVTVAVLWWGFGDPWLAILPGLFMAFGDGITGVVRNFFIRRRTKHVLGNVFMLAVSLPLGIVLAGQADPALAVWGGLAAVVASVVERYEFGPIDDNVLIAVASTAVLALGQAWVGS